MNTIAFGSSGFRVPSSEFRVPSSGLRVPSSAVGIQNSGFRQSAGRCKGLALTGWETRATLTGWKVCATIALCLAFVVGAACGQSAAAENGNGALLTHWDGSRSRPVHLLPLVDELNQLIAPMYKQSMPMSTRNTCGSCHDYPTIQKGLHFNSSSKDAMSGRPGEPWVWVDEKAGTQIPLTYRGWAGTYQPKAVGLTDWKFTLLFGRHLPGGDMAEPQRGIFDPDSRWETSGKLEINCLGCHDGTHRQDQSEWAKQIGRENLRWAATAANALGEVGGMASRMRGTWGPYDGPNKDDTEFAVAPSIRYNMSRFDSRLWAFFDVTRLPEPQRCQQCHSVSQQTGERWEIVEDVHVSKGMTCTRCHRNGLDHSILRGYEGEGAEHGKKQANVSEEFTCRGCHLGEAADGSKVRQGRLAAPRPEHAALPIIHLQKMTCTACHSGLAPRKEEAVAGKEGASDKEAGAAWRVRTSRANRLGVHGRAAWQTDMPNIIEPVFAKGPDGKIGAYRALWPAFWASLDKGGKVQPLAPDTVTVAVGSLFNTRKQIGDILGALANDPESTGTPVLVMLGKAYHRNADGEVNSAALKGASEDAPLLWARDFGEGVGVQPILPPFKLAEDGTLPAESETAIKNALQALGTLDDLPGTPSVVFAGKIFYREEDQMKIASWPENSEAPVWGWSKGSQLLPLAPALALRSVAATDGTPYTLTEEQVALGLKSLAAAKGEDGKLLVAGQAVYVAAGKLFQLGKDDKLAASDHDAAKPYLWALGHEARPAGQSLGARGCDECHAKDAPFFFGKVIAQSPLKTASKAVAKMKEFHESKFTEPMRPINKFFLWLIIITMTLLIAHIGADLYRNHWLKKA
ncbi:MAG: hypothetical protein NTX50_27075 [Candidatus Sumerlaeota bacterium]|nr:hypothetical protein [Candidatus Sumerlaeota bacterium]